jgi:hypothetical protein
MRRLKGLRVDRFLEFHISKIPLRYSPVKDKTYTIREVFLGREKIVNGGESATVGLLLEELHNPPDPFHAGQQELGFSSERFALLDELPDEENVEEEVAAGVIGFPGEVGAN